MSIQMLFCFVFVLFGGNITWTKVGKKSSRNISYRKKDISIQKSHT